MTKSRDLGFGILIFLWIKKGFLGTVAFFGRFWRSLEFESWNLKFEFWALEFRFRVASQKTQEKIHCLQNQIFHMFFGPMGLVGTLAIFFCVLERDGKSNANERHRKTHEKNKRNKKKQQNKQIKNKPITEKLVSEKPVSEKPVIEKSVSEKPVSGKPVSETPVSEKPVVCRHSPFAFDRSTEKPVTEKPVS